MSGPGAVTGGGSPQLRAWLEHVAQMAIDWLDELDRATEDLEDDELGDDAADRLSSPGAGR